MTSKELQLLNGLGLFRFYLYKFLRLVVRMFFPEDKCPELVQQLFRDRRMVEIVIDLDDIILYPEGTHEHSYYCKWRNYQVWIANEAYAMKMQDLDSHKRYQTEDLPGEFRRALYAAYLDKKRNSGGLVPTSEKFFVPADSLKVVGPLNHLS